IAKQARFDQEKREALGQLKGISNGGNFDSGLKGVESTGSDLKGAPSSGDSIALKTLPDVNTDSNTVDLSDRSMADANKALMRHQWAMSVDQRYKDDPQVQQYIRDLWDTASAEDMKRIRSILTDQLKVS